MKKKEELCCHYPGVGHCWHCDEIDNPQIQGSCPLWQQASSFKTPKKIAPLNYDWDEEGSSMLKRTVGKINEIIERLNNE